MGIFIFWWIVIAISGFVGIVALLTLIIASFSKEELAKARQQKAKRVLIIALIIFVVFGGVCLSMLSQPMNSH